MPIKPKLLIVDDDQEIRTQLKWALSVDYEIIMAEDRATALRAFKTNRPVVTMLDLGLPPEPNSPQEGMEVLNNILSIDQQAKVIIVSGQGEKENAIKAVGAGAYDFLCKPVDIQELTHGLKRAAYVARLERDYQDLQKNGRNDVFENMLGASSQMQGVFSFIRKVASTNAPVLLLGESGTGKEMAAVAIHRRSPRKAAPFVAINCSAIPENLLESELFGHEKGVFTGAHQQRKGLIETAEGGTLFLDEIGELAPAIQVKLLRFLQDQRFQRVGGRLDIQADTRVVAATHVDLKEAIKLGKFREDLFFRLAVVVLHMPPLRERGEDIVALARDFLHHYAAQSGKTLSFAPDAVRAITTHAWSGNVRELQNRVKRAGIMAEGKRITAADLELDEVATGRSPTSLKEARESVEREMIVQTLKKHSGKITGAATELGISRPTLYELMEKLGIQRQ